MVAIRQVYQRIYESKSRNYESKINRRQLMPYAVAVILIVAIFVMALIVASNERRLK